MIFKCVLFTIIGLGLVAYAIYKGVNLFSLADDWRALNGGPCYLSGVTNRTCGKISFDDFKKWVEFNRESWTLDKTTCYKIAPPERPSSCSRPENRWVDSLQKTIRYSVTFSFSDYIKYVNWLKEQATHEKEDKEKNNAIALLSKIKEDIEKEQEKQGRMTQNRIKEILDGDLPQVSNCEGEKRNG